MNTTQNNTIERIAVSMAEAAKMLGVSKSLIYVLRKRGAISAVPGTEGNGRRTLIRVSELHRFVREGIPQKEVA